MEIKTLELVEQHLASQHKIRSIFSSLEAFIQKGRTEKEVSDDIEHFLKSEGHKSWHPLVVKAGTNSFKKGVKHIPHATDAISDLCIVDIGIIINEVEADFAKTICFQESCKNLVSVAQTILKEALQIVASKKMSPSELFFWIDQRASDFGYSQICDTAGHRVGKYPTPKSVTKIRANEPQSTFEQGGWMVEIHIGDKNTQRGAFFEDFIYVS